MTGKSKLLLLILVVVFSIAAVAVYLLRPHSAVGEWESANCDVKLSVFKDKTAIRENLWGKDSCEWSAKDEGLIVLKCRIAYTSSDVVRTFQSSRGQSGTLDDRVLIRVDPNRVPCPKIESQRDKVGWRP